MNAFHATSGRLIRRELMTQRPIPTGEGGGEAAGEGRHERADAPLIRPSATFSRREKALKLVLFAGDCAFLVARRTMLARVQLRHAETPFERVIRTEVDR
jgi:hypothetical protein